MLLAQENVNKEEIITAEILKKITRRLPEAKIYETGLLWKSDDIILPESKTNSYGERQSICRTV